MDKLIGRLFEFITWYDGKPWYIQAVLSPAAVVIWAIATIWMQFNG